MNDTPPPPAVPRPSSAFDRLIGKSPPTPYGAAASGGIFDFQALRAILWRQRFVVIGVVGLALLAGLIITLLTRPTFEATSSVQVDVFQSQIVAGQEISDPYMNGPQTTQYLSTLGQVAQSRNVASSVVERMGLQDNAQLLGDSMSEPEEVRRERAIDIVQGNVDVQVPYEYFIVFFTYTDTNAELAAAIANGYADAFVEFNLQTEIEANSNALGYLEERIDELRGQVREAEIASNEYARSNGLILPSGGDEDDDERLGSSLTSISLGDTGAALNAARAARIQAERRWRAISGVPASELPEVIDNLAIQQLRTEQAGLRVQLSNLLERYRDDYPEVREVRARIEEITRNIARAESEIKNSIRREYEVALQQERGLQAELTRISGESLDEQNRRVQFDGLSREARALRQQLSALLERYNQLVTAANVQSSDATLLDRAQVPVSPTSPNPLRNMLLALIAGLGLAGGIAMVRELANDRLRSIEDVEKLLGVPALGQTPHVSEEVDAELENAFSPLSESYSSIRATIDYQLADLDHAVIQVTSSSAGEGKTTTAIALAEKFAGVGRKVLLVDLDLRRPSVAKSMGLPRPELDAVDVMYGRAELQSVIKATDRENLFVLPTAKTAPNPVEIMSSGLVPEFIANVRREFDVVIFDNSPVLGIADAPLLSRLVDAVVFVVEANSTPTKMAKTSVRRLQDMNAHLLGAIITKYKALPAGDSYNYQYQYYAYNASAE